MDIPEAVTELEYKSDGKSRDIALYITTLSEQNERLKSRGIEDMQFEIKSLREQAAVDKDFIVQYQREAESLREQLAEKKKEFVRMENAWRREVKGLKQALAQQEKAE